ncbi:hypothetical protein VSR68_37570 [Paraburkholderia phymatum]
MKQYALVATLVALIVLAFAVPAAHAVGQVFDRIGQTLNDIAVKTNPHG